MSDPPTTKTLIPRKPTTSDTTAVSMTTAGIGGVILWIFQCIHAHEILVPSDETAIMMGGFVLPIIQATRQAMLNRIERLAAVVAVVFVLIGLVPAHAQVAKPQAALTVLVPGYGVTTGVWAVTSGVGDFLADWELGQDGKWWGYAGNSLAPEYGGLDGPVSAAGGEAAYVTLKLPELQAILNRRYPGANVPLPSATAIDRVNAVLAQQYILAIQNGAPYLIHK